MAKKPAATAAEEWTALTTPLNRVVGTRTANALAKLGLETVEDLVLHVPFRLGQRGELMEMESAVEGQAVTVIARVLSSTLRPMNARKGFLLTVTITDGPHDMDLTFFGSSQRPLKYHELRLSPGTVATFSGKISAYRGRLQLTHPEYTVVEDEADVDRAEIARPVPIYHASEKVPSWHIAKAVDTILATLTEADFPDPLPEDFRVANSLPSKFEAIRTLHRPEDPASWEAARTRMKYEEAFVLQTVLAQRAAAARSVSVAASPRKKGGILDAFDARLPYTLTAGQVAIGGELADELAGTTPMNRLLQGDVGSGKTLVALRAMLQVVDAGGQAALLAPTEVLAQQHLITIENLMGPLAGGGQLMGADESTGVQLLTGSMSVKEKRIALSRIASGEAGIVVGTHALLSDQVQIPFLRMAVVDEQHRFGVDQRDKLSSGVHTLVMTATPIPRTLAMSVFGDLDVSTLRELPAGRAPITTNVVPTAKPAWVERAWERAAEEVANGGRVYVVCPRIDANEPEPEADNGGFEPSRDTYADALFDDAALGGPAEKRVLASVEDTAEDLRGRFGAAQVGVLHGRLDSDAKARAMAEFASGRTPIVVTTTVVEVGVDVPEATMMIILDADRFGLSQLHQLRGRIGRGTKPGLALAITAAEEGTLARERIDAFAATTDGFELAETDFKLRSEGDVLSAVQSGRKSSLRFLRVAFDGAIIETARAAARDLIDGDPHLTSHPELASVVTDIDESRTQYLERG